MGNEGKFDKRKVGLRIPLEICRAVEKTFYLPIDGENESHAFIRALEYATKDVVLTAKDLDIIKAEMERNCIERQQKRDGTYIPHPGKKKKK